MQKTGKKNFGAMVSVLLFVFFFMRWFVRQQNSTQRRVIELLVRFASSIWFLSRCINESISITNIRAKLN